MKTEEAIVQGLKGEGYDSVYAWEAEPGEVEEEHEHLFDTRIVVITGEMHIKVLKDDRMETYRLAPGQEIEIPRAARHAATSGAEGCRYVVGEMH